MKPLPVCILYSEDDALALRLSGFLRSMADVRHVADREQADAMLQQQGPCLAAVDLRAPKSLELVSAQMDRPRPAVMLALGHPDSEPLRYAEGLGVFDTESLSADHRRIQACLRRAITHLQLVTENRLLRDAREQPAAPRPQPPGRPSTARLPAAFREFTRLARSFDDLDSLHDSVADWAASATGVSRVGIFTRDPEHGDFRFRAGIRCLAEIEHLVYPADHPLAQWMARHAHLISRGGLDLIPALETRLLLGDALDACGAEVILPLLARRGLIGWLFLGRRATGYPFSEADLEELGAVSDYVSTLLENARLYKAVALQRSLAATLLDIMPMGIVVIDPSGVVRWFNRAAETIFDVEPPSVLGRSIQELRSRVADLLLRTLEQPEPPPPSEWTDGSTNRRISVQSRRLEGGGDSFGVVALIEDVTRLRLLKEQEEQLERSQFWTDLAACISHEIRNPLVTIKTFAQLLPSRYENAEFREQYSCTVQEEIGRLEELISQIHRFANPPQPEIGPVNLRLALETAVTSVREECSDQAVRVTSEFPDEPLELYGDAKALEYCFTHLVMNAFESLRETAVPTLHIDVKQARDELGQQALMVLFRDNGRQIPAGDLDRLFSPFHTTKARGLGLGLPIVKRTLLDHGGNLSVDSSSHGTTVTLLLPLSGRAVPPIP